MWRFVLPYVLVVPVAYGLLSLAHHGVFGSHGPVIALIIGASVMGGFASALGSLGAPRVREPLWRLLFKRAARRG
jgi:hypothetical protein